MTIDEAIEKYREKGNPYGSCCEGCEKEHEQLAEWLEELIMLREEKSEFPIVAKDNYEMGYNKAIADFVEKLKENISESLIWGMIADCFKYKNMNDTSDKIVDYVIDTANEIAEHLKGGGDNA